MTQNPAPVDKKIVGALYYPYIHIHDVNWLRATLLLFPHVQRMIPFGTTPKGDGEGVKDFLDFNDGELLRPARLYSERAEAAQVKLAKNILRDAKKRIFKEKFGVEAARKRYTGENDCGFQIHAQKLHSDLTDALAKNRLGWKPNRFEPYSSYGDEYIEVHPRVGEAIMSTLAIACAMGDDLDIVGDYRSGALHRCLLQKDYESVYDTWLGNELRIEPPPEVTDKELMDIIVGVPADLPSLTPEFLYQFRDDREPLEKFISALRTRARSLPSMDPGKQRDEFIMDEVLEIEKAWEKDKLNMSSFARAFFKPDSAKLVTDAASKVAEKYLTQPVLKATGTGAGVGLIGGTIEQAVVGAVGGLVFGLIAHANTTFSNVRQLEQNSPYRYLTLLEKSGIALFKSEALVSHKKDD